MQSIEEASTRAELLASGLGRRGLAAALRSGQITRARRDRYFAAGAAEPLIHAVRVGGRLACLSLLQLLGVFVFENSVVHIHVERGASRLRSPSHAHRRLEPRTDRSARVHWRPLLRPTRCTAARVDIVDALIQSVLCQQARYAIATLDSALNKRLIRMPQLDVIFDALPSRYAALRPLLDGRAQSGPETLVRLMLRALGCIVVPQVRFDGVGRVDLVADGWLVIECDSREFHADWEQQVKDRERDLALAARGYVCVRLTAAQIMYRPEDVLAALRGLIDARRSAGS